MQEKYSMWTGEAGELLREHKHKVFVFNILVMILYAFLNFNLWSCPCMLLPVTYPWFFLFLQYFLCWRIIWTTISTSVVSIFALSSPQPMKQLQLRLRPCWFFVQTYCMVCCVKLVKTMQTQGYCCENFSSVMHIQGVSKNVPNG